MARAGEVKLNIGGVTARPERPDRAAAVQRAGHDRRIESDLIRMRTREGMKVAKAKGRLRGKAPKLSPAQETHPVGLYRAGQYTTAELAELFSVGRSIVYRAVQRAGQPKAAGSRS